MRIKAICLALTFVILQGCGPNKMTPEAISTENKAIGSVVTDFWKAYGSKNWGGMNTLFTAKGEFYCYGTDSVRSTASPWQTTGYERAFPGVEPGEFWAYSIQYLDDRGALASVFCQLQASVTIGGQIAQTIVRFAAVMKKENGQWRIHHCMASFPVCQPSPEALAKLQGK
jgi:hypothetical protein